MNANTTLERVRDLAQTKLTQLQPLAGEEMTRPQDDGHRDGFIDGERTLAAQIIRLIDHADACGEALSDVGPVEEEMVLSLGRT